MLPIRIRRLVAVGIGAATLVAVTAVPASAKTATPEKWGKAFCGGLSEWADTITTGGTEIAASVTDGTTPAAGKTIIVGYIGDIGDATSAFYSTVKKAGAPDSINGAKIQKEILKGIAGIETRVGDMEDQAQNLPTSDPASFQTAVSALSSDFDTVSTPFDDAMTKVAKLDKKDSLSKKLRKVKECKELF